MRVSKVWQQLLQQEDLNFLLTNRIPRLAATRFMGWFSQIRHPLVVRLSIAVWKLFSDLDLSDSKVKTFRSLQECFTRELAPGARPIDSKEEWMTSPCDAIVGASGTVHQGQVFQAKGFPYSVGELFGRPEDVSPYEGGTFVTLRLTSAMYHRFHAPYDVIARHVTFHSGDTWNVNPIALKRVERLFCKNERAVIHLTTNQGLPVALVPVAAILVASLRLHFLDDLLHNAYQGPTEIPCAAAFQKGQEMGWFQHGSTIIVFLPPGVCLHPSVVEGSRIRMGERLARLASPIRSAPTEPQTASPRQLLG
jgi:phosphatidylserine decarboxylase